jgi:hypothetical protein
MKKLLRIIMRETGLSIEEVLMYVAMIYAAAMALGGMVGANLK